MPLEHLENAPLVEAILEFTFPGEPSVMTRMHEYYDYVRESYPEVWVPFAQVGQAPALQPWEFKNPGNNRIVAVSINSFAYRVRDYADFPDFKRSVLPLASKFCEFFGISKVNRLAARYVNSITLLRLPGEAIRLKNYLNLGIELPSAIDAEALEDIHLQFASESKGLQVVINLHHERGERGSPESLVFVLDCALQDNVVTGNLETDIEKIHVKIEDTFKVLIAETYMRYLRGETA